MPGFSRRRSRATGGADSRLLCRAVRATETQSVRSHLLQSSAQEHQENHTEGEGTGERMETR
jgi:hypothetical protein